MTDLEVLSSMLLRAKVMFEVDQGHGWPRRLVLEREVCFCFDSSGGLSTIRSEDDNKSFDGRR